MPAPYPTIHRGQLVLIDTQDPTTGCRLALGGRDILAEQWRLDEVMRDAGHDPVKALRIMLERGS